MIDTILKLLAAWVLLSIPLGILTGRVLHWCGRHDDMER